MAFLLFKYLHLISSGLLFGTTIGSFLLLYSANRSRDLQRIYIASHYAVTTDRMFIIPALILQLASGFAMIYAVGYALKEHWIMLGLSFYAVAVLFWIPLFYTQLKMRHMAKAVVETTKTLPTDYWNLHRKWMIFAVMVFVTVLLVFYVMVFKP